MSSAEISTESIESTVSHVSRVGYERDGRLFEDYCREHGFATYPATVPILRSYFLSSKAFTRSAYTAARTLSGLAYLHRIRGLDIAWTPEDRRGMLAEVQARIDALNVPEPTPEELATRAERNATVQLLRALSAAEESPEWRQGYDRLAQVIESGAHRTL